MTVDLSAEAPEELADRLGRLRAELIEQAAAEKRAGLQAEIGGHVDVAAAMAVHAGALEQLFADIEGGLPTLVALARSAPSDRHALPAARAWWRRSREVIADKAQAKADTMPERVAWRGPWRSGANRTPDPDSEVASVNDRRQRETPEKRAERMRRMRDDGMTLQAIADKVGVSVKTVHRAVQPTLSDDKVEPDDLPLQKPVRLKGKDNKNRPTQYRPRAPVAATTDKKAAPKAPAAMDREATEQAAARRHRRR